MPEAIFTFEDAGAARTLQARLAARVVRRDDGGAVRVVTGVDVAYDTQKNLCIAAAASLDADTLAPFECRIVRHEPTVPYIPGLFSFLEGPAVCAAVEALETRPDLVVCDGHGIAHPRRFGLASHVGLALGIPTIGCAKTRLVGTHDEPDAARDSRTDLMDKDEIVGAVLRTQDGVKPVFVSIGHRISLDAACTRILALAPRYRLPETTRAADGAVRAAMKATLP